MKRRSSLSGFESGMMGTHVSMAETYTGAGSGAVAGFDAGGAAAAACAVADILGGAIFAVVARTARIFCVGSIPIVSLEMMSAKLRDL